MTALRSVSRALTRATVALLLLLALLGERRAPIATADAACTAHELATRVHVKIVFVVPGPLYTFIAPRCSEYAELAFRRANDDCTVTGVFFELVYAAYDMCTAALAVRSVNDAVRVHGATTVAFIGFGCDPDARAGGLLTGAAAIAAFSPSVQDATIADATLYLGFMQTAPGQVLEMGALWQIAYAHNMHHNPCILYTGTDQTQVADWEIFTLIGRVQYGVTGIPSQQMPNSIDDATPALASVQTLIDSGQCKTFAVLGKYAPVLAAASAMTQLGAMSAARGGHMCLLNGYAAVTVFASFLIPAWAQLYALTVGCFGLGIHSNWESPAGVLADSEYAYYFPAEAAAAGISGAGFSTAAADTEIHDAGFRESATDGRDADADLETLEELVASGEEHHVHRFFSAAVRKLRALGRPVRRDAIQLAYEYYRDVRALKLAREAVAAAAATAVTSTVKDEIASFAREASSSSSSSSSPAKRFQATAPHEVAADLYDAIQQDAAIEEYSPAMLAMLEPGNAAAFEVATGVVRSAASVVGGGGAVSAVPPTRLRPRFRAETVDESVHLQEGGWKGTTDFILAEIQLIAADHPGQNLSALLFANQSLMITYASDPRASVVGVNGEVQLDATGLLVEGQFEVWNNQGHQAWAVVGLTIGNRTEPIQNAPPLVFPDYPQPLGTSVAPVPYDVEYAPGETMPCGSYAWGSVSSWALAAAPAFALSVPLLYKNLVQARRSAGAAAAAAASGGGDADTKRRRRLAATWRWSVAFAVVVTVALWDDMMTFGTLLRPAYGATTVRWTAFLLLGVPLGWCAVAVGALLLAPPAASIATASATPSADSVRGRRRVGGAAATSTAGGNRSTVSNHSRHRGDGAVLSQKPSPSSVAAAAVGATDVRVVIREAPIPATESTVTQVATGHSTGRSASSHTVRSPPSSHPASPHQPAVAQNLLFPPTAAAPTALRLAPRVNAGGDGERADAATRAETTASTVVELVGGPGALVIDVGSGTNGTSAGPPAPSDSIGENSATYYPLNSLSTVASASPKTPKTPKTPTFSHLSAPMVAAAPSIGGGGGGSGPPIALSTKTRRALAATATSLAFWVSSTDASSYRVASIGGENNSDVAATTRTDDSGVDDADSGGERAPTVVVAIPSATVPGATSSQAAAATAAARPVTVHRSLVFGPTNGSGVGGGADDDDLLDGVDGDGGGDDDIDVGAADYLDQMRAYDYEYTENEPMLSGVGGATHTMSSRGGGGGGGGDLEVENRLSSRCRSAHWRKLPPVFAGASLAAAIACTYSAMLAYVLTNPAVRFEVGVGWSLLAYAAAATLAAVACERFVYARTNETWYALLLAAAPIAYFFLAGQGVVCVATRSDVAAALADTAAGLAPELVVEVSAVLLIVVLAAAFVAIVGSSNWLVGMVMKQVRARDRLLVGERAQSRAHERAKRDHALEARLCSLFAINTAMRAVVVSPEMLEWCAVLLPPPPPPPTSVTATAAANGQQASPTAIVVAATTPTDAKSPTSAPPAGSVPRAFSMSPAARPSEVKSQQQQHHKSASGGLRSDNGGGGGHLPLTALVPWPPGAPVDRKAWMQCVAARTYLTIVLGREYSAENMAFINAVQAYETAPDAQQRVALGRRLAFQWFRAEKTDMNYSGQLYVRMRVALRNVLRLRTGMNGVGGSLGFVSTGVGVGVAAAAGGAQPLAPVGAATADDASDYAVFKRGLFDECADEVAKLVASGQLTGTVEKNERHQFVSWLCQARAIRHARH